MTQTIAHHPLASERKWRDGARNLRAVRGCFAGVDVEFDRSLHGAAKPQSNVSPYQRSRSRVRLVALPAQMNASRCALTLQHTLAPRAATASFTGTHLPLEPVSKLTESLLGSRFVAVTGNPGLSLADVQLTLQILRVVGGAQNKFTLAR